MPKSKKIPEHDLPFWEVADDLLYKQEELPFYKPEKLKPKKNQRWRKEPYATFDKMRKIKKETFDEFFFHFYGYTYQYQQVKENFFAQAAFMEGFTDDFEGEEEMYALYNVTYADMDDEQLRTYFTWRTRVRAGDVRKTSFPYALCYLYELINGFGAANPEDGMNKLIAFWKGYRVHNDRIDHYLKGWIRDYYILHQPKLIQDFQGYQSKFPIAYGEIPDEDMNKALSFQWDELRIIELSSSFRISYGAFYKTTNSALIEQCVCHVLTGLTTSMKARGVDFQKLFAKKVRTSFPSLFREAIYKEKTTFPRNYKVQLTAYERIKKRKGDWCREYISLTEHKTVVGYLLKLIEINMRQQFGFKKSLVKPNISQLENNLLENGPRYRRIPGKPGLERVTTWKEQMYNFLSDEHLETIIAKSIEKFCQENHVVINNGQVRIIKPVSIDTSKLEQVRQDHRETEKRLQTDEYETKTPEKMAQVSIHIKEPGNAKKPVMQLQEDCESGLLPILTEEEKNVLLSILNAAGKQPQVGIQLELLVESINEKALETLGDNLIDRSDEGFYIYEEYLPELNQYLRRNA